MFLDSHVLPSRLVAVSSRCNFERAIAPQQAEGKSVFLIVERAKAELGPIGVKIVAALTESVSHSLQCCRVRVEVDDLRSRPGSSMARPALWVT